MVNYRKQSSGIEVNESHDIRDVSCLEDQEGFYTFRRTYSHEVGQHPERTFAELLAFYDHFTLVSLVRVTSHDHKKRSLLFTHHTVVYPQIRVPDT